MFLRRLFKIKRGEKPRQKKVKKKALYTRRKKRLTRLARLKRYYKTLQRIKTKPRQKKVKKKVRRRIPPNCAF